MTVTAGVSARDRTRPTADVRVVDPRTDPRWRGLVSGPGGSLFTSPPWLTALADTYDFTPTARVHLDAAGRPTAGLAWVDVDDLRGRRRIALPFSDRADPVVSDRTAWDDVAADALAGDLPFTLRCLDSSPVVGDPRLTAVGEAAYHVIPLDRPLDELFAAFRKGTRRDIRLAERSGVRVVLSDDLAGVREMHRLQVALRKRKYRLLAQPWELFERIWEQFAPADGVRTALALVDGDVVAAGMYLVWQDTVYLKFAASAPEHLRACPNEAVHWALIRWAHDRGLRTLDWGLSDLDQPGLVSYKSKWASTETRVRTFNAGGSPLGRRSDVEDALRSVTELLTEPSVPESVTARGGAALYRYFC